jgi:hypothetical protein
MKKDKSEEMNKDIQLQIRRLNHSIGLFSIEVNEDIKIKEMGEHFDKEFAEDFGKILQSIKEFKDKWAEIYRKEEEKTCEKCGKILTCTTEPFCIECDPELNNEYEAPVLNGECLQCKERFKVQFYGDIYCPLCHSQKYGQIKWNGKSSKPA